LISVTVYANHGRWVADCPRPHCGNAEQYGWDMYRTRGGLTESSFRCREERGGCGLVCEAVWPAKHADIEWILQQRPAVATRNWLPGETLLDLMNENLEHGIAPMSQAALDDPNHPGGVVLRIENDEIQGGLLTAGTWRTEIGGKKVPSGLD